MIGAFILVSSTGSPVITVMLVAILASALAVGVAFSVIGARPQSPDWNGKARMRAPGAEAASRRTFTIRGTSLAFDEDPEKIVTRKISAIFHPRSRS